MRHPCQELVRDIIKAVCDEAEKIKRFKETKQGCLRLTFYPANAAANSWLGGFPYADNYIPDLEITYPILPGGTRLAVFEETDAKTGKKNEVIIDTYTITAGKVAAVSYVQDDGVMLSGQVNLPDFIMENGFAPWKGAVCTEVYARKPDGMFADYCGLYVSVSGAEAEEDLRCAAAAIPVIKKFFGKPGYACRLPEIDPSFLRKGRMMPDEMPQLILGLFVV